jgi:prevent-host-death family protein
VDSQPGSPGASWPGRTLRFLPTDTRRTVNVPPGSTAGGGYDKPRIVRFRGGALVRACVFRPARVTARCYRPYMAYPLTAAQSHLGELVAEARQSHRPVTISENGEPVAALINIDDLADLQDRAALAAHQADKAAGREGTSLDELDAALDQIDASTLS